MLSGVCISDALVFKAKPRCRLDIKINNDKREFRPGKPFGSPRLISMISADPPEKQLLLIFARASHGATDVCKNFE